MLSIFDAQRLARELQIYDVAGALAPSGVARRGRRRSRPGTPALMVIDEAAVPALSHVDGIHPILVICALRSRGQSGSGGSQCHSVVALIESCISPEIEMGLVGKLKDQCIGDCAKFLGTDTSEIIDDGNTIRGEPTLSP
jgi:hypothetical protein